MNPNKNKQIVNFGDYGKIDFSVFRYRNTVSENNWSYKNYSERVLDYLKCGTKEFNSKVLNGVERLSKFKTDTTILTKIETSVNGFFSLFTGRGKVSTQENIYHLREVQFRDSDFDYKVRLLKESIREATGVGKVEIVNDPYFEGFFGIYFDSMKPYTDMSYFEKMDLSEDEDKLFKNGKNILLTIIVNFKSLTSSIYSHIGKEDDEYTTRIRNEFMCTFLSSILRDQNRIRISQQISLFLRILAESNETGLSMINSINRNRTNQWASDSIETRRKAYKIVTDIYGDYLKEFEMNSLLADLKDPNHFSRNFDFTRYRALKQYDNSKQEDKVNYCCEDCCDEVEPSDYKNNPRFSLLYALDKSYDEIIFDPLDLILIIEGSPLIYSEVLKCLGPVVKSYVDNGKINNSNTNSLRTVDIRNYESSSVKRKLLVSRIIPFLQYCVFMQNSGKTYNAYNKVFDVFDRIGIADMIIDGYDNDKVFTDLCKDTVNASKEYGEKFRNPMTTTENVINVTYDAIVSYTGKENNIVVEEVN